MYVKLDNRVGLEANHRITDREKILLQGLNVEGVNVTLLSKKLKKKLKKAEQEAAREALELMGL